MNRYTKNFIEKVYAEHGRAFKNSDAVHKALIQSAKALLEVDRKVNRRRVAACHYTLNDRARLAEKLREAQVNGLVSFNTDNMDCDCAQWTAGSVVKAQPFLVWHMVEELSDNAEGLTSYWIAGPDECVSYQSRDLALEAFEDGHPHVVYR